MVFSVLSSATTLAISVTLPEGLSRLRVSVMQIDRSRTCHVPSVPSAALQGTFLRGCGHASASIGTDVGPTDAADRVARREHVAILRVFNDDELILCAACMLAPTSVLHSGLQHAIYPSFLVCACFMLVLGQSLTQVPARFIVGVEVGSRDERIRLSLVQTPTASFEAEY